MTVSFLAGLLRRARGGDEDAFSRLVEATRERLFWTVKRMVGREALAEEILQDAYLALWSLPRSASPDEPEAWLRRVCVNRALDHLRREETKTLVVDAGVLDRLPGGLRVDEALSAAEVEEALEEAMWVLPGQERVAFVLKVIEGLDYKAAAALLGVSESTVRNQVMQARRKIGKTLAEKGIES